jgi:ribosomal protein S12 methylthiotransferase
MKPQVSKKTAAERKRIIEERQIPISEKQMDRFIGKTLDVLVEEKFEGEDGDEGLYLGRLYCQAPEVDGAAVITGKAAPGALVRGKITGRAGFDLEVRVK